MPHKYSTQRMSSICLCLQVDVNQVNAELRSLKPASKGALDPVSKLWPGHYGAEVQQKHDAGFSSLADDMPTSGGSSAGR